VISKQTKAATITTDYSGPVYLHFLRYAHIYSRPEFEIGKNWMVNRRKRCKCCCILSEESILLPAWNYRKEGIDAEIIHHSPNCPR